LTTIFTGKTAPTNDELTNTVKKIQQNSTIEKKISKTKKRNYVRISIPLPSNNILSKAKEIKPVVNNYANKRNIDEALVLALIHTESAFNPLARSHIPAYGLMQIVPKSAGIDASKMLFGKKIILSPSYLYNEENNVKIGTAYLHILFYNYLKKIKNKESRLYCTISAYNTGAGNVAKAFIGTKNINKASTYINNISSEEVYKKLIKNLPYDETRKYLKKVYKRINMYGSI
jgi:membrane-bound lytic murein transglycosylase C